MKRVNRRLVVWIAMVVALAVLPARTRADDSTSSRSRDPAVASREYKRLLREIKAERERIEELEQKVRTIEEENRKLQQATTTLERTTTSLQASTQKVSAQGQEITQIKQQLTKQYGPEGYGDVVNAFLGQHLWSLAGAAGVGFAYDRQAGRNQLTFDFEPIMMFRPVDWINFVGEFEAGLEPGGDVAGVSNPLANFEVFPFGLEFPLELQGGVIDVPFGDFFENVGPMWVNPFMTSPLVYGSESIVTPTDIAIAMRGGVQWGALGQDFDYTVWVGNGPAFQSVPGIAAIPKPVIGEAMTAVNEVNVATNGKTVGARFRFYPLPIELGLGRLELEASTINGKWLDGLWYHAWGVGYAYRTGPFRSRGEWVQTYRDMPNLTGAAVYPGCCGHDNRQGWYAQFGYFLYGIPHPDLGPLERYFNKTELSVRYSGVNQRGIVANDIESLPAFDTNGSPSLFAAHAREVALAIDYWIAPSIVWQNEIDFELPQAGGTLFTFAPGATRPTASPILRVHNDRAAMTRLTVGW